MTGGYRTLFDARIILALSLALFAACPMAFGELVDQGNGTVLDTTTDLMWEQAGDGQGYTWQGALAHCEDLEFAGHADWKLPDAFELQSILDYSLVDDPIPAVFTAEPNSYWTSSQFVEPPYGGEDLSLAWVGKLYDGSFAPGHFIEGKERTDLRALCVRVNQ